MVMENRNWLKWIAIAVVVAVVPVLWFRVSFGGMSPDEILTWAQCCRFFQGDVILRDDLSLAPFSSFCLVPIYRIAVWLGCSHEGVLLFGRHAFVVTWVIFLAVVMWRWYKIDKVASILGFLSLVFLPPRYFFNLSYNSFAFIGVLGAVTFFATNIYRNWFFYVLSGAFLVIGALGIPQVAVIYLWFMTLAWLTDKKGMLWVTLGCTIAAGAFLSALFSQVSPNEAIAAILGMTSGDSAHTVRPFFDYCVRPPWSIMTSLGHWALGALYFALLFVVMLDKKRKMRCNVYVLLFSVLIVCAYMFDLTYQSANWGHMALVPLPMLAIACALITWDRNIITKAFAWMFPAFAFASLFAAASNTMRLAAATGIGVAMMPAIILLSEMRTELPMLKRLFSMLIGIHLVIAIVLVPWRQWLDLKTTYMTDGPLKGIYEYDQFIHDHYSDLSEVRDLQKSGCKLFAYVGDYYDVWSYLATDMRCGMFTVWQSKLLNAYSGKIIDYWTKNNKKIPDAILVRKSQYGDFKKYLGDVVAEYGFVEQLQPSGNFLYKRVQSEK